MRMRQFARTLFLGLAMQVVVSSDARSETGVRLIATRVEVAPVIDGALDDAVWSLGAILPAHRDKLVALAHPDGSTRAR